MFFGHFYWNVFAIKILFSSDCERINQLIEKSMVANESYLKNIMENTDEIR